MAEHKLNPKPGEVWAHPKTLTSYRIHSVTDDGWTRYYSDYRDSPGYPLYTEPTLNFISKYEKASWGNV